MLEELGHVEEDREERDREEVLEESIAGVLLHDRAVVVRSGDGNVSLQGHSDRHQDGSRHGDVVERVEELRSEELIVACVNVWG